MRTLLFSAVLSTACLAACQPAAAPTTADAPDAAAAPSAAAPSPATTARTSKDLAGALDATLSKGMAYADMRRSLLAQGWLPLVSPKCQENVGGEAAICNEIAELDACSGDGRCVMRFAHGNHGPTLRVDATGDYLQWQATADDATLRIDGWQLQGAPAVANSGACPAGDFKAFLAAFAADDAVQMAHTAPLVRVMQSWDAGEGTRRFASFETAADYRGFRMQHRADGFHIVDADGRADDAPTPLAITPRDAGAYQVSYRYGMSEGNTFRFEKTGNCWTLVGDPQAPTP